MFSNPCQKRVLTLEDMSCFGKCSTTVALPILSVMGHETVSLPTAILSTHTGGFTGYHVRDLTDDILPISAHWMRASIVFDCIYSGYLCKGRQVSLVRDLVRQHKRKETVFIADPAMADNGSYYYGFDAAHGADMLELCRMADVITPNVTEAAFLLGEEFPSDGYDLAYVRGLISRLREAGVRSIVLTSVSVSEGYGIVGYDAASDKEFSYFHSRIGHPLHGSGDVYTSVMIGKLLRGASLEQASRFAADFVRKCVAYTVPHVDAHPYGLIYEPLLGGLLK